MQVDVIIADLEMDSKDVDKGNKISKEQGIKGTKEGKRVRKRGKSKEKGEKGKEVNEGKRSE